jgi:hypothetical protein
VFYGTSATTLFSTVSAVRSHTTTFVLICFGVTLLSTGCNPSSVSRLPIHGTVQTASGERFDASICFKPVDGKGPVANGSVKNGEFKFSRSDGPTAGPNNVIVHRLVHRGDSIPSRTKPKAGAATAGPPAKSEWTLPATIVDDGKYTQDFTLKD